MSRAENVYELPENLPVPIADVACNHLTGLQLPPVPLLSTDGSLVNLASLPGRTVVYCYSRTCTPDQELPEGWTLIPVARGCTPQSCAFRYHYHGLPRAGA